MHMDRMKRSLRPTSTIDCDNQVIKEKAKLLTEGQGSVVEEAKSLFYFVRDGIKYNPYLLTRNREEFRASATLERGVGFCIQKAILLAALARAVGIPSRLGFADIRNSTAPGKIIEFMGTDMFICHGYCELYIDGAWIKATPAFDLKMCEENRIIPVEFDGKNDAIFHPYTLDGEPSIEYVTNYGHYDDLPLDKVADAWARGYPSWEL